MTLALALVGCGGMGRRHILGIKKLQQVNRLPFDLAAVCDVMPENLEKAASLAEELLGTRPQTFSDLTTLIRTVQLDGIILTTSPEMHDAVGLEAFAAGLHVLAEKPITLTVPQGVKLVEAGRQANLKLAVAENYRRDPINRLAKALIDGGVLGRPFLALQHSSGAGEFVIITPWRHLKSRGGIIVDMGIHYADLLEYYLGPIESVVGMNAVVDRQRVDQQGVSHPADAEDLSIGVARYQSGALANYVLSMAGRGEGLFSRMIYGTGGSLSIPGDRSGRPLNLRLRQNGKDVEIPQDEILNLLPDFALDDLTAALFGGERLRTYEMPWQDIDANLLAIEQSDFVDAIINDREPEVNGEQGLRSLAMIYGFLESELIGRIVTVDEILHRDDLPYQLQIQQGDR
jgi:predicted dehydrogenase